MGKIKYILFMFLFSLPAFALTVTDLLNREVSLEKPANRVIALGTSLSYVTYLNSVDKVIGIEAIELKDVKKRAYTYVNRNKIKSLPIVGQGGKAKRPNLEAIITLRPDVIFTIVQDKSEADLLSKQLNIPVVVVGYGVESVEFEDIYKSLQIMGKILNKQNRAESLISYIKNLQKEFKRVEKRSRAYIGAVAYKGLQGITSTKTDFMPFRFSQVENIAFDLQKKGHLFIDKEYLLMKNPSRIFLDNAGWELILQEFNKDKSYFKRLKAFKDSSYLILANTFYYINIDQMLANSFFIAKTIYPKQYKDLDPIKKSNEIFEAFVGEPLYDMFKEDTGGFQKVYLENEKLKLKSIL
ncbi:ABC transporter substrate-binding protein [Halarcobacter ebronensis]|uniref:ABC transporter substrate-binding protein n=1 Tax=Halarcobacter ebronensis TaxID=1462615 RepID=A0A4V1M002_9BACT|nr:ABC transporter substrate-binding protein [Halarcobacter ebronensis]QKF82980.1 iron siderophore ABC transporter, periplasmic substrate-binding protein [Halarcobacter ebronensis]RXK02822.1 ABC transporter substrate-binding protein [Halarcobacter ebronensis]